MADGDGPAFTLGVGDGAIKLRDDRGLRRRVVQKLRIAKGGANAVFFGGVVGYSFFCCAAVHKEQAAMLERLHQRIHQCGICGGARSLMIVHARGMRNAFQHRAQNLIYLI